MNNCNCDFGLKEYRLFIDSRDRDRTIYPNSNFFSINLKDLSVRMKNIHSIQLQNIILPYSFLGITTVSYLNFQIQELETNDRFGSNNEFDKSFSILPINNLISSQVNFKFSKKKYEPPKASLSKLTFSFKSPDGTLADFGIDNPLPSDPDIEKQVLIQLKIKCKEKEKNKCFIN